MFEDDQFSISGRETNARVVDRFSLSNGLELPCGLLQQFEFRIRQCGHETDVLANNFGWIIASLRLVRILRESGCNIQTIPLCSNDIPGCKGLGVYHVVNLLSQANALDKERAEYAVELNDTNTPFIASITKLVLRGDAARKMLPLFRLSESKGHIIASESVVQRLKQEGIRGIGFDPVRVS